MEQVIIFCRNNGQKVSVPMGATLEEAYQLTGLEMKYGPVLAHVNNGCITPARWSSST